MQKLPLQLLQSLQDVAGFDEAAFVRAHEERESVTSIRFQPHKYSVFNEQYSTDDLKLPIKKTVPWCDNAYYLSERPSFTFDPLFHAGLYYVQEASSMFLWEVLKQAIGDDTKGKKVLDLCAAPGGKSTLLSSYFTDGFVVSNEVIKSRANILAENITKWGNANVIVTNNDPSHFQRLDGFFDVMLIDAPCSGSGLFRKDNDAIGEWSEEAVNLCSLRQQRIVADAYSCLKENGILIYSTCSYSTEEDETILDWMMESFQLSAIDIQLKEEWNIAESISPKHKAYGYRFYPDKVKGEGFFIAAFVKKDGSHFSTSVNKPPTLATAKEKDALLPWIHNETPLTFIKQGDIIIAIPEETGSYLPTLQKALYIKQAGVALGQMKGADVIPHHALAVSVLANTSLPKLEMTRQQAIQYLQKKDINIDFVSLKNGWQIATYCGMPLGWLKVLPNRANNYYPPEWRILKN